MNGVPDQSISIKGVCYGSLRTPTYVSLADGGFVVAWQSRAADDAGYHLHVQRLDARGAAAGKPVVVNVLSSPREVWAAVAPVDDGGFVVYWQHKASAGAQGWGQRFDAQGALHGAVCGFEPGTTGDTPPRAVIA